MRFSRQEYRSGLPFPSPGDLPDPGIEPGSPILQVDSLPSETLGGHTYTEKKKEVIVSVQLLNRVRLFATPWIAARQASLSITNSRSSLRLTSISDAIQPSHPLSSPSPLAPNPSQHQSLFQWVNSSHEVAKVVVYMNSNLTGCLLFLFAKSVNHRWELLRDLQPRSAVSFLPSGNCTATKLVSPGRLTQTWGHVHYSQLDSSVNTRKCE